MAQTLKRERPVADLADRSDLALNLFPQAVVGLAVPDLSATPDHGPRFMTCCVVAHLNRSPIGGYRRSYSHVWMQEARPLFPK